MKTRKIFNHQKGDLAADRSLSSALTPRDKGIRAWRITAVRVLRRLKPGKQKINTKQRKGSLAKKLSRKLWGGFSRYALRDLEELKRSVSALPTERGKAAWHLARWYAFEHDYTRALDCVVFARVIDPSTPPKKDQRLLEVDCLLRLRHIREARKILDQELEDKGHDADFCLAYANTFMSADGLSGDPESDAARLEWINRIYVERGLLPLAKADPLRPLGIDNLGTQPRTIQDQRSAQSLAHPSNL